MHRFYYPLPIDETVQTVVLPPEESHHAAKVVRLSPGDEIGLLDNRNLWRGIIEDISDKQTVVRIAGCCESPESSVQVTLLQGLPKTEKLEWIIQKATELGVWRVFPVETERSIPRADRISGKMERLQKIALEAAKQSGRAHMPEITYPCTLQHILPILQNENFDLILIAWEEEHTIRMSQAVQEYVNQQGLPKKVLLIIGPEGGLSAEECDKFASIGAKSVTLEKRIMRTETAGICALSVLWCALGEM